MSYENKIRFSMLCCTFVCTCVSVCGDNICELSDVSRRLWGLSYAHIHQSGHRASCGLVLQWFHLDAGGENVGSVHLSQYNLQMIKWDKKLTLKEGIDQMDTLLI